MFPLAGEARGINKLLIPGGDSLRVLRMLGPVEFLAIEFPGNQFKGEIAPELQKLVDSKLIKIIDLVFVTKDARGNTKSIELENIDSDTGKFFHKLGVDVSGLISEVDIDNMAETLSPDSSAAFLLFEHLWAVKLRDAVLNADGRLIADERIPVAVIEKALESKKLEIHR